MLPCHARCVLSRLCCNGHSLLLGSYLSRIGRIGNPSCSACEYSSQDISHLILHCPATDSLHRSLWRLSVSLRPLVQTLGQWFSTRVPRNPRVPPVQYRGSARSYTNFHLILLIKLNAVFLYKTIKILHRGSSSH